MDMEKWLEDNIKCLADFNGNETGDVSEAILVNDLRELLKTHMIVPNELVNEAVSLKVEPFRSGGFINKGYDMARLSVDLPIVEARKLYKKINECYVHILKAAQENS